MTRKEILEKVFEQVTARLEESISNAEFLYDAEKKTVDVFIRVPVAVARIKIESVISNEAFNTIVKEMKK